MKLNTALVAVLCLFGTVSAFAPQRTAAGTRRAPLTKLEMAYACGAKRKAALKVAKKVAGTVGCVALATAGLSPAACAAVAAVESAKGAKDIISVGAGAFAAGVVTDKLLKKLSGDATLKPVENIEKIFSGPKSNEKL